MLSIHRLSAGEGFRYLLRHTASGDIDRATASSLTSYYAASGYPPGRWLGSGLAGLPGGQLAPGAEVAEAQMANLYGRGLDPVAGTPLGRPYPVFRTWQERAAARVDRLDPDLSPSARAAAVARVEAEERRRRTPTAVAGFDMTFSPVKSVSALWAIADNQTRQQITAAHHEALDDILAVMEREVAFTRTGAGGVAQVDTRGLIAAAFDHWDTRAGDPQLHTHLVIANRVQGPDGGWRTLDGRALYAATVALSETYNDLLADKLTARLGVDWEHRERRCQPGRDRNPAFEISQVPQALLEELSARTTQIEQHLQDLVAEHRDQTGREPSRRDMYVLRQRATLLERPHKDTPKPLTELVDSWKQRAEAVLGRDPRRVVGQAVGKSQRKPLTSVQVDESMIAGYAATVLLAVQQQRATWNRWNIMAEAARQTRALRLATATDRLEVLDRVVDQMLTESVSLSAPELVDVPDRFRRVDGESVFSVHHADRYTSTTILGAEAYLVDRAGTTTGTTLADACCEQAIATSGNSSPLGEEQAEAVRRIATSGRPVDVLVGAAGAGKTTTLRALRQAWEAEHGPGSVVGLAPSSAAAEVLANGLGVSTENTAKWLYESVGEGAQRRADTTARTPTATAPAGGNPGLGVAVRPHQQRYSAAADHDRWRLVKDQLVIVDEASLAGTLDLAAIARQAHDVGAKVLLVGDDAQLSAVEAGGAFRLLAKHTGAAELTGVWRFHHQWERRASLRLRRGDRSVIDAYTAHDRISEGDHEAMTDAAYHAWLADTRASKTSMLLAVDNDTVTTLNQRARLERIQTGEVEAAGTRLRDGSDVGVGDRIVTRLNARQLLDSRGRSVRNGSAWTITHRSSDGSLTARRDDGGTVTLPPGYVAESVELGYAATVHRAQGVTVDTTHVVASPGMSREALYVGMTRGRDANHAYVITHEQPPEDHQDEPPKTAEEVLTGILAWSGVERSATEVMRQQLDEACSLARLVPMYEHMAQAAAGDHWHAQVTAAGLEPERVPEVVYSPAWPALVAGLRQAQAQGLDSGRLLAASITRADFTGAHDTAAVLHARLDAATRAARRNGLGHQQPAHAGLITPATGVENPVMARMLSETEDLIAQRAADLIQRAITEHPTWLNCLGRAPTRHDARGKWEQAVTIIAAYRERHDVTTGDPLGPQPPAHDHTRRRDHAQATAAVDTARSLSEAGRRRATNAPVAVPNNAISSLFIHGVRPRMLRAAESTLPSRPRWSP